MNDELFDRLISECLLKAVISGGKGGQHVNKVASRVELYFDVKVSKYLSDVQKETVLLRLNSKISQDGVLRLVSSSDRSQFRNRKIVIDKFIAAISSALVQKKKRKETVVPKFSKEERMLKKRLNAEIKKLRKKPEGY